MFCHDSIRQPLAQIKVTEKICAQQKHELCLTTWKIFIEQNPLWIEVATFLLCTCSPPRATRAQDECFHCWGVGKKRSRSTKRDLTPSPPNQPVVGFSHSSFPRRRPSPTTTSANQSPRVDILPLSQPQIRESKANVRVYDQARSS